jgi:hypothetical protein
MINFLLRHFDPILFYNAPFKVPLANSHHITYTIKYVEMMETRVFEASDFCTMCGWKINSKVQLYIQLESITLFTPNEHLEFVLILYA